MLRTPLISKVAGRKLDFSTGDPTKDKLLMGGLIVVIIAAIAAMAWSLSHGKKNQPGDAVSKKAVLICVNPQCTYKDVMDRQAYYKKLEEELTYEELRGMVPPRTMCPECNHPGKTVVEALVCPKCGEPFVNPEVLFSVRRQLGFPAQPPGPKLICPHCNTDFLAFKAQQRADAKKK